MQISTENSSDLEKMRYKNKVVGENEKKRRAKNQNGICPCPPFLLRKIFLWQEKGRKVLPILSDNENDKSVMRESVFLAWLKRARNGTMRR